MPLSEAKRIYQKEWRIKNPDYWKRYGRDHKEHMREWRFRNPRKSTFTIAKSRAKRLGVPFTIVFEDIKWPTHCPVLGLELSYDKAHCGRRKIHGNLPSLDRLENNKGYTPENVRVISHRANRLKSDMTVEEVEALLRYMKPDVNQELIPPR